MLDHRPALAADQPILIVDDDASVRTMLATMFMSDGWEVVEAEDGDEGLKVTLDIHPWAAVVDVQMPGLGGLHLARVLRQAGLGSEQLRIIVFTAGITREQDAIEAGADSFFLKEDWLLLRQALLADDLAPGQPGGGPVFAVCTPEIPSDHPKLGDPRGAESQGGTAIRSCQRRTSRG